MPVRECQEDGKPGFCWGDRGKCYTYTPGRQHEKAQARMKAEMQRVAAERAGYRGK